MSKPEVDLAGLFNTVAEVLKEEKGPLNEADSYNHNHGDHMVENFALITAALEQKQGTPPAEQLAYASQLLDQNLSSGSARVYSQGLNRAANQLQGQSAVTSENALSLVQALLGGEENASLPQPETKGKPAPGITPETLLTLGSAFIEAQQKGDAPVQALIKAFIAAGQMKESPHQSQSGQVVGETLVNVLTTMLGGEESAAKPKPESEAKPKPKPATKPKPKPATKPKPKPKPAAKPKPEAVSKPKPKPKPATKPKPQPETESEAKAKPKAKPKPATKPKAKS
jgi:hypothetical protein